MHIKDFVLQNKFGGGFADWEFLEEIDKYCYDEFGVDVGDEIMEGVNHIHDIFENYFDLIKEKREEYISEQEGEKVELELENFFNYLDSHIDLGGDYYWSDTKEEAYKTRKENQ